MAEFKDDLTRDAERVLEDLASEHDVDDHDEPTLQALLGDAQEVIVQLMKRLESRDQMIEAVRANNTQLHNRKILDRNLIRTLERMLGDPKVFRMTLLGEIAAYKAQRDA